MKKKKKIHKYYVQLNEIQAKIYMERKMIENIMTVSLYQTPLTVDEVTGNAK